MFSAFFGHYLLNENVVTNIQLKDALALQDVVHLKLGTVAINAGYLSVEQVEGLHKMQQTCDKRFGDLAIASKYMTESQLTELLNTQKSEHLLLAQSLVDLDILTIEEFNKHMSNYKAAHSLSSTGLEALQGGNVEAIVDTFLSFDHEAVGNFYKDYVSLFIKNHVRFISGHIRIGEMKLIKKETYEHMIRQTLFTDCEHVTAIAGDANALTEFASIYAEEDFKELGEYPIDAIGEYMNQHNGLFIVNKTNEGLDISMDIQVHIEGPTLEPSKELYDIPLYSTYGEIHLLLGQL